MTRKQRSPRRAQTDEQNPATADQVQKEIEQLAYTFYCQCGYEHGHDLEHWIKAERRVRERYQGTRNAEE